MNTDIDCAHDGDAEHPLTGDDTPMRRRRHALGLSLLDLSPLTDCDPGNLSRIERRVQVPRADVAARIAAALGMDEREVLYPERYVGEGRSDAAAAAGGGGDGR